MQLGSADTRLNPIAQEWPGRPHARGAGGPIERHSCGQAGSEGGQSVAGMLAGRELQGRQGCSLGGAACQVASRKERPSLCGGRDGSKGSHSKPHFQVDCEVFRKETETFGPGSLSKHPESFFYGSDICLHLPEIHRISWLDVLSYSLDLLQNLRDCVCIFPDRFYIVPHFQKKRYGFVHLRCGPHSRKLPGGHDVAGIVF